MVIANPDIFERLNWTVVGLRQVVVFESWLSQQCVEVQQSVIPVLISIPVKVNGSRNQLEKLCQLLQKNGSITRQNDS